MAKIVRQFGLALWVIVPLALVVLFFAFPKDKASATTFTYDNPFFQLNSPFPEKPCDGCCDGPSEFTLPGISVRTGEVVQDLDIGFSYPGTVGNNRVTLRYRSYLSGGSQFGCVRHCQGSGQVVAGWPFFPNPLTNSVEPGTQSGSAFGG